MEQRELVTHDRDRLQEAAHRVLDYWYRRVITVESRSLVSWEHAMKELDDALAKDTGRD